MFPRDVLDISPGTNSTYVNATVFYIGISTSGDLVCDRWKKLSLFLIVDVGHIFSLS